MSPDRVERQGFEYKRQARCRSTPLNVRTGEVRGKATAPHTSRDFVGLLREVVATRDPDEELHVRVLVEERLDELRPVGGQGVEDHRSISPTTSTAVRSPIRDARNATCGPMGRATRPLRLAA